MAETVGRSWFMMCVIACEQEDNISGQLNPLLHRGEKSSWNYCNYTLDSLLYVCVSYYYLFLFSIKSFLTYGQQWAVGILQDICSLIYFYFPFSAHSSPRVNFRFVLKYTKLSCFGGFSSTRWERGISKSTMWDWFQSTGQPSVQIQISAQQALGKKERMLRVTHILTQ